ncbi:hypothetical protein S40285_00216 [Stachybotrys chlorohalonatus IBT 40285]|uniref:PEBP-like protein n=1 Tax=Stachybotrys chlorohalonatus (strain IBT 40285) TaxID=1283841 RepID=A0A084QU60_STAC4|nr:hypothetical protein S40285_00216 [Stachybotrys chlorohalonata IBT 40285]
MAAYIESTISWLLLNAKGRDAAAFPTVPAFADHPEPTVAVRSPDCGEAGSSLGREYMVDGEGRIPELEWDAVPGVQQWLLVAEDLDAPLPTPFCHGIFLGIPKDTTAIIHSDIQPDKGSKEHRLAGGFHYGQSQLGPIYMIPRPLLDHGPHRYHFNVIALKEPLDQVFVASRPSRAKVAQAIEGKVLAWGRWTAVCERKWRS